MSANFSALPEIAALFRMRNVSTENIARIDLFTSGRMQQNPVVVVSLLTVCESHDPNYSECEDSLGNAN